ncbi:MAG: fluoride efflux transporter FluC [Spartobacteria bacterium]
MIEFLLIAALGAAGALVRYHLGAFVHSSANHALASEAGFPFGTLFVNALGSFILGAAAAFLSVSMLPQVMYVAIGAGFCGSLTTFSTLAVDLQRFLRDRRFVAFALLLGASAATGLGATWLGLALVFFVR